MNDNGYNLNKLASLLIFRKSCQLFYKADPLKITHGKGAYMYDERGNRYLDGVNNVAHGEYLHYRCH